MISVRKGSTKVQPRTGVKRHGKKKRLINFKDERRISPYVSLDTRVIQQTVGIQGAGRKQRL